VDGREEWIAGEESGWLGGVDSWRGEWMVRRSGWVGEESGRFRRVNG
jgi:hypothetical protein